MKLRCIGDGGTGVRRDEEIGQVPMSKQGGEAMKRLTLAAFFLVVFVGLAQAQTTAKFGLYADPDGLQASCQASIGIYETDSIYIYYVKGNGYDLGNAVQFRMVLSNPDALFSPAPRWASQFNLSIGDLENGIALTAATCLGVSQSIVWLGRIGVEYDGFDISTPFTARVVEHPETGDISITRCNVQQTVISVRGSWFVFNGVCDLAVKPTSWGAIKGLYK
jgi:hypothetical protein